MEFHLCHAKRHSICFYHNIKDNERSICQDLLTTENTDSELKVHALHYANELLVRVSLSFQKLLQTRSTWRNNTKKCLGKEWWPVLVVDKSADHDKPHFNLFFTAAAISTPKKFFQSASWLRHSTLRGTLTRAAWYGQGIDSFRQRPSDFWLVRSGHAHASYPGLSFRLRVRSQHIWGGKKGEFRDWTSITCGCWSFLASGFRLVFEGLFIWAQ